MPKITREKWKVWGNVFDEFTLRTIFKLSSKGYFEDLESPICVGKESNVFTAKTKEGRIIVKIYRLETCDFNHMYDYIKGDPRYASLKKQRRKIIFAWTQREYRNLMKSREAGVNCPTPLAFTNNVLLLEYIGDEHISEIALKIKDDVPENLQKFFDEVIENMKKLYKVGYVHGDLSAFNILNYKQRPVLIDFSACTILDDSRAEEYLIRDIRNVCAFFKKQGLKVDEAEAKQRITGKALKTKN